MKIIQLCQYFRPPTLLGPQTKSYQPSQDHYVTEFVICPTLSCIPEGHCRY